MMGAPDIRSKASRDGSAGCFTRLHRRVPTTELPWCGETCMPMRCGKHYGCQGTRARCVGYKPTNTNPCPRVGYPALGAGHARNQGGFVHKFSTRIAPYSTFLQLISMQMSLILLICSTRSLSRSCSTSGTSHHGQQRLQEAGGVVHTNNRHINKKQPAIIDHAWSRVRWILRFTIYFTFILLYFYFNIFFYVTYTSHYFQFSCKCRSIR